MKKFVSKKMRTELPNQRRQNRNKQTDSKRDMMIQDLSLESLC